MEIVEEKMTETRRTNRMEVRRSLHQLLGVELDELRIEVDVGILEETCKIVIGEGEDHKDLSSMVVGFVA